jgi:hypothetical protein
LFGPCQRTFYTFHAGVRDLPLLCHVVTS